MKNLKDYIINIAITIAIFVLIFSLFEFDKIVEVILNSNYYFLATALVAYFGVVTIMTLRIRMILNKMKYFPSFKSIMESNLAGMIASDFTPARSGYFFTAFSLSSKHKIKINDSILTIFGPQLFDFTIKAVSLSIMIIILLNAIDGFGENILFTLLAIIGIFSVIGFFGALLFLKGFLKKFSIVKKMPFGDKIYSLFYLMQKNSYKLMDIKWKIILITFASWAMKAAEWYLLTRALGITIFDGGIMDYAFMLVFQGTTTLVQFIPLPTLAGGGASEVGFSGLLFLFGIPIETGIAFALLTRGVMIVIDVLGTGELIRYIRKEGIKKVFEEINSMDHF